MTLKSVAVIVVGWLVPVLVLAGERSLPSDPAKLVDPEGIPRYTARKITGKVTIDGKLDETSWTGAVRTTRFVDLVTGARTVHDTRAAILWDDQYLYVGFWIEEPLVCAKYRNRNAPIYYDNDVELFIAGKDAYYELEINAFGTTYEAFFIWQDAYQRDGYSRVPGFRRSDPRVQDFYGVGFNKHPRGKRIACIRWAFPTLESAVYVDGTLNDDKDRDRGWTAELALPWRGMKYLATGDGRRLPPAEGDVWRIDLFRFNRYKEAPPATDSGGWAWGRHAVWDSHLPEIFPYVTFSAKTVRK
jgi:hypothetical protein